MAKKKIKTLDDALAAVEEVEYQATAICILATQQDDWREVWIAQAHQREPLEALKKMLSDRWRELYDG